MSINSENGCTVSMFLWCLSVFSNMDLVLLPCPSINSSWQSSWQYSVDIKLTKLIITFSTEYCFLPDSESILHRCFSDIITNSSKPVSDSSVCHISSLVPRWRKQTSASARETAQTRTLTTCSSSSSLATAVSVRPASCSATPTTRSATHL